MYPFLEQKVIQSCREKQWHVSKPYNKGIRKSIQGQQRNNLNLEVIQDTSPGHLRLFLSIRNGLFLEQRNTKLNKMSNILLGSVCTWGLV